MNERMNEFLFTPLTGTYHEGVVCVHHILGCRPTV